MDAQNQSSRKATPGKRLELIVDDAQIGWRLDAFLAQQLSDYSRAHLRRVINAGAVSVDCCICKPSYRLRRAQRVSLVLPTLPQDGPEAEDIPLDILYEDEHLAVVNKPPGMIVHPARGNWSGTLAGALQFHFSENLSSGSGPTRPGIVHRLDRDTSGAILVAKNNQVHAKLAGQFKARTISKEYFALTLGCPLRDRDVIESSIGRHPRQREKMAVRRHGPESRPAETFYEVLERFDGFAAVRALPKTGRTHQIRVHLDQIGCAVLCDRLYGGRSRITRGDIRRDAEDKLVLLNRQALHASRLQFIHPANGTVLEIEAPLPNDIMHVLEELRKYRPL